MLISYRFALFLLRSRIQAFLFALIVITNPFIWFHGEVALSYIFDGLFSVLFGFLAIKSLREKKLELLFLFSFFLGFSGGFRETLIIFFTPLWIVTLFIFFKEQKSGTHIFLNVCVAVFGFLLWSLPLFHLSGGVHNYFSINTSYFTFTAQRTSVLLGVPLASAFSQIKNVIGATLALINILIATPFLFFFSSFRKTISLFSFLKHDLIGIFSVWILPSLLFYLFIHFGNPGYLMTIAVPVVFLASLPLLLLTKHTHRNFAFGGIALIIIFQLFHFTIDYKIPERIKKISPFWKIGTAASLHQHDMLIKHYIKAIQSFDPSKTLLMTESGFYYRQANTNTFTRNSLEFFRHAQYYVPEYSLYELMWDHAQPPFYTKNKKPFSVITHNSIIVDKKIENIIILADSLDKEEFEKNTVHIIPLANGKKLFVLDFKDKNTLSYAGYTFEKK